MFMKGVCLKQERLKESFNFIIDKYRNDIKEKLC